MIVVSEDHLHKRGILNFHEVCIRMLFKIPRVLIVIPILYWENEFLNRADFSVPSLPRIKPTRNNCTRFFLSGLYFFQSTPYGTWFYSYIFFPNSQRMIEGEKIQGQKLSFYTPFKLGRWISSVDCLSQKNLIIYWEYRLRRYLIYHSICNFRYTVSMPRDVFHSSLLVDTYLTGTPLPGRHWGGRTRRGCCSGSSRGSESRGWWCSPVGVRRSTLEGEGLRFLQAKPNPNQTPIKPVQASPKQMKLN